MDIAAIPLFSMLRQRLGYVSERQRVISQNVANADTPGYAPRDLKPFTFQAKVQASAMMAPAQTSARHLTGLSPSGSGAFRETDTPDSETTLDGNAVVLEDQMLKMTEARLEYDAAIGFYQKSLNLLRMAARPPGR